MQPNTTSHRRVLAALIASGGILGALYLTLFPFDFFAREPLSLSAILARFDTHFISRYTLKDFPRNIALFVPIGFGLYPLLSDRIAQPIRLLGAALAGVLLAVAIEVGQIFLSGRFTAVADVLANGLGAAIGALIAGWIGTPVLEAIAQLLRRIHLILTPIRAATALLLWIALVLMLLTREQGRVSFGSWDQAAPLLVANEADASRPWQGTVVGFSLAASARSADAIAPLFTGAALPLPDAPQAAYYTLNAVGTYVDQRGIWPELLPQPVHEGNNWWRSAVVPHALTQAISDAEAFTLVVDLRSANADQRGPARIISLSNGIWERNLTIGQEQADLVIRMRNGISDPNGRYPSLLIRNVFADSQLHRIVVSANASEARVYVDTPAAGSSFRFTPAYTFFISHPPVDISDVYIEHLQGWIFQLLFTTLIYVPGGLLLLYIFPIRYKPIVRIAIVSGILLLIALLFEGGMAYTRSDRLDSAAVILAISVGSAAAAVLLFLQRSSKPSAQPAPPHDTNPIEIHAH